jgi:adenylate cyclase
MSDSMAQMKQGLKNFQKFVPGDVVREILRQNCGVQLGVSSRRLTILFIDLANFTTISESVAPGILIKLLSQFFTEMSQAVMQTGGTIDKFIGDAIMAFWNAPMDVANHEICAVEAGLDMLARLDRLKKSVSDQVFHEVGVRIGIYTADSLIGNVGSPERISKFLNVFTNM